MAFLLLIGFHLAIIFFLSFWMWKRQEIELKPYFWPAIILKLIAGIALGLIYKYHYTADDTFSFFHDAHKLTALFWKDPQTYFKFLWAGSELDSVLSLLVNIQKRSLFFVKVVSFVNILAGDNYWTTCLYFSGISFWASFRLFEKIAASFPKSRWAAAMAFLFFPSVVFWSSGIIKESFAMAGLFVLSRVCLALLFNSKIPWWEWVLGCVAVFVVWNLKYYWIAVFTPVATTTLLVHFLTRSGKLGGNLKIVIWMVSFLILCFTITLSHPNFYLENFLRVLFDNYNEFIRIPGQGIVVHYQLEPSWWSVILNSPLALATGFFRPFIWESHNVLQVLVSIENFLTFVLFVLACFRLRLLTNSPHRLLIFSVIVYIVILCLFLALSTPNLGTLSRYKVGFQPFLIFMLVTNNAFTDWLRIKLT